MTAAIIQGVSGKTFHILNDLGLSNGRRFYYERCGGHFLVTLILWSPEKYTPVYKNKMSWEHIN